MRDPNEYMIVIEDDTSPKASLLLNKQELDSLYDQLKQVIQEQDNDLG